MAAADYLPAKRPGSKLRICASVATILEEALEKLRGFGLAYAAKNVGPMMACRLSEYPGAVDDTSALRVLGGKSDAAEPSQRCGRGTHRAGFEGHPKRAPVQSRLAERFGRCANCHHFRMGGGIEIAAHRVSSFRHDLVAASDDRADRHFAGRRGFRSKVERPAHR